MTYRATRIAREALDRHSVPSIDQNISS